MRPLHLIIPFAVALGASAAPYVAQAQVAVDVSITTPPPELPVYDQPPAARSRLHLYAGLLGVWRCRLLLGARHLGRATAARPALDAPATGAGIPVATSSMVAIGARPSVTMAASIMASGYGGLGYEGGYWRGGSFFYNHAVNSFGGVHVTNVYEKNVTNVTINRYSFNGPNGVTRRASPAELAAATGATRSADGDAGAAHPGGPPEPRAAGFGQPWAASHSGHAAPGCLHRSADNWSNRRPGSGASSSPAHRACRQALRNGDAHASHVTRRGDPGRGATSGAA